MVTARASRRRFANRLRVGPSLRLSALVVLLLGILVSHGMQAEGAGGHLGIAASAPATAPAPTDGDTGHPHDSDPSHPDERCLSGQPQQSAGTAHVPPCLPRSVRESDRADSHAAPPGGPATAAPAHGTSPVALIAASLVRQV
ncbi:hypothetical protein ACIQNG_32420 [Streptomyces sp. NPDC091377]|uniref:hypothetical protein n=1 Tax=Streptomyces sp. NPDC091377 TaxID=3365995 RepID=UPI0037FF3539